VVLMPPLAITAPQLERLATVARAGIDAVTARI
jgi:adenosylmethionine-8-amino-7-oxononanoate aminotransferase